MQQWHLPGAMAATLTSQVNWNTYVAVGPSCCSQLWDDEAGVLKASYYPDQKGGPPCWRNRGEGKGCLGGWRQASQRTIPSSVRTKIWRLPKPDQQGVTDIPLWAVALLETKIYSACPRPGYMPPPMLMGAQVEAERRPCHRDLWCERRRRCSLQGISTWPM